MTTQTKYVHLIYAVSIGMYVNVLNDSKEYGFWVFLTYIVAMNIYRIYESKEAK